MIEIVLPEELLCFAFISSETHIACNAITSHEDISAIFALENDLAIASVDDAELCLVALVVGIDIVHQAVRRSVHWLACCKVHDAECLAVWDIAAAISLGLYYSEVVELCNTSVLAILVEGKERHTRALERDELI